MLSMVYINGANLNVDSSGFAGLCRQTELFFGSKVSKKDTIHSEN